MDSEDDDKPEGRPLATADVIVELDDAVVWEWSFETLQAFLEKERLISNALAAYINYDLRAKIINTSTSVTNRRVFEEITEKRFS